MVRLELESRLACRLGERFDPAMISVMSAIQLDRLDSGCCRLFRDQLADFCGGVAVPAVFDFAANGFIAGAGTGQRLTRQIVDHLATKMLQRPLHAKPWLFGSSTQLVSHVVAATLPLFLNFLVLIHLVTDRKIDLVVIDSRGLGRSWL